MIRKIRKWDEEFISLLDLKSVINEVREGYRLSHNGDSTAALDALSRRMENEIRFGPEWKGPRSPT